MKCLGSVSLLFLVVGCASSPVEHYREQFEGITAPGKKDDVAKLYGTPRFCATIADGETCEYAVTPRTDIPNTDILHVYFNAQGTALGWEPMYLP